MKNKILQIAIIIFAIMILSSTQAFAKTSPSDYTGETNVISDGDIDISFIDDITDFVQIIGTFLAVGVLMILGIRYALRKLRR